MSGLRESGQRDRTARGAQDTREDVEIFKLLFTSTLTATVFIPHAGDEMSQNQMIARAEGAQRRVATPNHISLGIFASASCVEGPERKGAYSVVFRQMSPGTRDHGEVFKMGWNLSSFVTDEHDANGLAIAQAVRIADQRLRAIPVGPHGGAPGKVTVNVFTASKPALRDIINPAEAQGPRRAIRARISSLVHEEVQKLANIPGMRVELILYWLPAKCGVTSQNEAGKIAIKCRSNGKNFFFVNEEERPSAEMPKSVSSMIADVLIRERLRLDKKRKTGRKATPATTTSIKTAHATTEPAIDQDRHALSPGETPKTLSQEHRPDHSEPRDPSPAPDGPDLMTKGEEQADEGCQAPLDEQALVDRQLLIESYEHHIRCCRERALPGRSTRGTEQIYSGIADDYCGYLRELVPDHPLVQVPERPTHPLMAALFSP